MDRERVATILLLALALGGCFGLPVSRSNVEEKLQTTAIEVGIADRAQVRQVVGQPLVSSDYWRFDLFRIEDWNRGVLFFIYLPIPQWEKNEGFVLVTYRDDGRVAGVATGHRAEGLWIVPSAESEASVELGELQLWTQEGRAQLAASWSRRDEYLAGSPTLDGCRLVIGCDQSDCPASIVIDPAPGSGQAAEDVGGLTKIKLPNSEAVDLRAVTVTTVPPGHHRAAVVLDDQKEPVVDWTQFDCAAGETRYVLMSVDFDFKSEGLFGNWKRYRAAVGVTVEMPSVLSTQPMLIWRDGRWLVPQEPSVWARTD